ATGAAREAGALAREGWRKHPVSERKGRVELVTRFDRESETLLRDRLTRGAPYPVVGEEQGGQGVRRPDEPTWFVDPIDGTTNFVHGHPFWCVSVGLVAGGRPILGAVVAPVLGIEWTGVAGGDGAPPQATRDGQRCIVSEVAALEDALLATGFPYVERDVRPN